MKRIYTLTLTSPDGKLCREIELPVQKVHPRKGWTEATCIWANDILILINSIKQAVLVDINKLGEDK